MKPTLVRSVLALALVGMTTLTGASTASAGATDVRPATCTFSADGSGYCSGSLKAFRTSSDAGAYLIFSSAVYAVGNPERWVYVRYGATYKQLQLLSTAPAALLTKFDSVSVAVDANIWVQWDTTNKVTGLQTFNDSRLIP